MVEETEKIIENRKVETPAEPGSTNGHDDNKKISNGKIVLVHCWRGGMRSAGVAWLLDLYGFKVFTLTGGYKFFRRWVLQQFDHPWSLNILGGYTGSGKTELLKQLATKEELVVDLEAIANHKGSAFGNIGQPGQPSQEMFENLLGVQLHSTVSNENSNKGKENGLHTSNANHKAVWLEDESQRIGSVNIPQALWLQMRKAKLYFVDIPFSERLDHIIEEYGQLDTERMISAIERIQKRLGGLEAKTSIELITEGNTREAFRILLKYYDKWYQKGLNNRTNSEEFCTTIKLNSVDPVENAKKLTQYFEKSRTPKIVTNERGYR